MEEMTVLRSRSCLLQRNEKAMVIPPAAKRERLRRDQMMVSLRSMLEQRGGRRRSRRRSVSMEVEVERKGQLCEGRDY